MVWELSSWYHTLDLGFRTRIVGETDFPCITDLRVGQARSYVSDGRTHLMDFEIDGVKAGTPGSEVALAGPETIRAKVRAAALLNAAPDAGMKGRPYDQRPYWSIERARAGNSQEVNVELVMNGEVIASKPIRADGTVQDVTFDVTIERSSWVAVRILAAAHSNPMFVLVGGRPIRASSASAQWALTAVRQCWSQKAPRISPGKHRPHAPLMTTLKPVTSNSQLNAPVTERL